MANVINRINNEFDFNYQKFIKNNTITETNTIKSLDNQTSKFSSDTTSRPVPVDVETMDFDAEIPNEENVEVLDLDEDNN